MLFFTPGDLEKKKKNQLLLAKSCWMHLCFPLCSHLRDTRDMTNLNFQRTLEIFSGG